VTPAWSSVVRLLLWDYERGSLAYDLACLAILALLLLVPAELWGDPLAAAEADPRTLLP
jgi:hypothetical protein